MRLGKVLPSRPLDMTLVGWAAQWEVLSDMHQSRARVDNSLIEAVTYTEAGRSVAVLVHKRNGLGRRGRAPGQQSAC
eukprot:scaffold2928_cov304-Prasinococcus_capsulatus_cf.AAC.4